MPIRFTSPGLGGFRESSLRPLPWQVGLSYRRLTANKVFAGSQLNNAAGPGGQALFYDINSVDFSVSRGLTSRLSVTATVPLSRALRSKINADGLRHEYQTFGLGDVSVEGTMWVRDPRRFTKGNVLVALGAKAPTGSFEKQINLYNANGSVSQRSADESAQPGNGGWGIIVRAQAFQEIVHRLGAYVVGSYLISPGDTATRHFPRDGPLSEGSKALPAGVAFAIPDVYSLRAGAAYVPWFTQRLSVSLGARLDGIPVHDLIGDSERGFRRSGWVLYADPGAVYRFGRNEITLSIPVRVHQKFLWSLIERRLGVPPTGDLADYLIFAGYSRAF